MTIVLSELTLKEKKKTIIPDETPKSDTLAEYACKRNRRVFIEWLQILQHRMTTKMYKVNGLINIRLLNLKCTNYPSTDYKARWVSIQKEKNLKD